MLCRCCLAGPYWGLSLRLPMALRHPSLPASMGGHPGKVSSQTHVHMCHVQT